MIILKNIQHHVFYCKDIINNTIDFNSLIIIRDVLNHLKNDDILTIFKNIKNKFNFIAITSYKNDINSNNFNQLHFVEKNINISPFKIRTALN